MSSERMRRVNEAIREVIGEVASKELKDPRVGFVTVTDVKTSPDLRHARVYVSALDSRGHAMTESEREATLEGLRSAHGYLQHRVADELHLKHTPVLNFVYDDTPERALRLGELIDAAGEHGGGEQEERE
jgi:ribosome-binding factor A